MDVSFSRRCPESASFAFLQLAPGEKVSQHNWTLASLLASMSEPNSCKSTWASMSSSLAYLLVSLICVTSATSNLYDAFKNQGRSLGQSSYGNGATVRLTSYRLPDLVLYYLPNEGGPGQRHFNISRPFMHAFPVGWKLLFLPSIISGSPNRWYCSICCFQIVI